jgi:hypothetical protein
MLKVFKRYQIRIINMDLSNNKIGRIGLVNLRWFLEEEKLAFDNLNLSDNLVSLLKACSILEMRYGPINTRVIYTKEHPREKKSKGK